MPASLPSPPNPLHGSLGAAVYRITPKNCVFGVYQPCARRVAGQVAPSRMAGRQKPTHRNPLQHACQRDSQISVGCRLQKIPINHRRLPGVARHQLGVTELRCVLGGTAAVLGVSVAFMGTATLQIACACAVAF